MCGCGRLARTGGDCARAALAAAFALALGCGSDDRPPGDRDDPATEDKDGGRTAGSRDAGGGAGTGEAGRGPARSVDGVIPEPADEAAYIYDQNELRTYDLILAPDSLAQIDADPRAEEYVPGVLLFEEREYGPVGIRYKGSVGAFRDCLDFLFGTKACTKLSMKVSFNWLDPEGRFYGLRKLQFHAMNRDPSMLKERLGYAMMRESDLAAPRAVHARLRVNGRLLGLFALVEQIDGRFTRSRFTEGGEGNLYKEAWPLDSDGRATDEDELRAQLETNEDEMPELDGMLGFGRALERSEPDALGNAIGDFTDLDYAMRYVAVDRTIAHDDGPFHWYCGGGGSSCSNHNFYWYERAAGDRLWMIVWDLDSAFNLDNTTTTLWMSWEDTSLGCEPVSREPYVIPQRVAICDKLTFGWAQQQERYLDEVETFLEGPFAEAAVEEKLRAWEAQITPAVMEAAELHDDAVSPSAWRRAAAGLRSAIAELRGRARERLARGSIPPRDPRFVPPPDAGTMDGGIVVTQPTSDAGMQPMDASTPPKDSSPPEDATPPDEDDGGDVQDPDSDAG
jgi:hypothetical protein